MWLAPVAWTVEGRAASEQTWIMFFPFCGPDYRAARRAGEGHMLVIARSESDDPSSLAMRATRGVAIARNDVLPHSRDAIRPGFTIVALDIRGRRECRVPLHPQPRVRKDKSTQAKSPQVRRLTRHSLRDGFTVSFVISLVSRAFLPPSPRNAKHCRELTPASGRQDHTTSPSATCAFVSCAARVHRIPHPTSVTIAIRPS